LTKIITHIEALEKARNYCAYQERCQQEVIEKLKSFKLNKDEMDYVLLLLIQGNYLNEERFARAYASGKFRIKKWGKRKIAFHLGSKGLTKKCIELGLSEIDNDEYFETLNQLVSSKLETTHEPNPYKKKSKIYSYLYGRGYESNLINEIFQDKFED
jgi:regulatory protein